jgi:Fe2+ or Zn2+ uptake regulation protein
MGGDMRAMARDIGVLNKNIGAMSINMANMNQSMAEKKEMNRPRVYRKLHFLRAWGRVNLHTAADRPVDVVRAQGSVV